MMISGLTDIKWERLFLALALTFLVADNLPHPQLGSSLSRMGTEQLHGAWANAQAKFTAQSQAAQP